MIKLRNGTLESEYLKMLKHLNILLLDDDSKVKIYAELKCIYTEVKSAYVLSYFGEPDYEVFTILVNNESVTEIAYEITDNVIEIIKTKNLNEYRRQLKKHGQIKLLLALELGRL